MCNSSFKNNHWVSGAHWRIQTVFHVMFVRYVSVYNPLSAPAYFITYLSITKKGRSLLVCTLTQHWAQLTSRLVPSSATWGLDSCPSPLSFILLVWVLKHISGMSGLDHWRPPGRFTTITLEVPLLDSDLKRKSQEACLHIISDNH